MAIGQLVGEKGKPDEHFTRLQAILARIEGRRKSAPDSPALEAAAHSIRVRIGRLLDSAFPTDPFVP